MSYRTSKIYQGGSGGGSSSGGGSVLETTFDITGMLAIPMDTLLPYGIINLTSSNPTETIHALTSLSGLRKYIFRPAHGLTVTFTDKTVAPPVPTPNLKLAAPSIDVVGDGDGYIALQSRTSGGDAYEMEYLDQYTP